MKGGNTFVQGLQVLSSQAAGMMVSDKRNAREGSALIYLHDSDARGARERREGPGSH